MNKQLDLGALLQIIEDRAELLDGEHAETIKQITAIMASRAAFQEVMNRRD